MRNDGCYQCKVENGWSCFGVSPTRCNPLNPTQCGNGVIESGEECDDSNVGNGDGCSSSCKKE